MTGIMTTIGPNSEQLDVVEELIELGVTSFRFPASKMSPEDLAAQASDVKAIGDRKGVDLCLVLDVPGSKARLTNLDGFPVDPGQRIRIQFDPVPAQPPATLGVDGAGLAGHVEAGDVLVVGDGEDAFAVLEVDSEGMDVRALTAGVLGRRRGVVILGKHRGVCLTDEDRRTLRFLPSTCFHAAILSFVEAKDQVAAAREILGDASPAMRPPLGVMAKIETSAGCDEAQVIADAADAVMLGRGDLLLSVGERAFYRRALDVERAALAADRPLVVGTQIFTSLSGSWLPNRSELSYACELIARGVAGIMFSFETTVGMSPRRSVQLLAELIDEYGTHRALGFGPRMRYEPR